MGKPAQRLQVDGKISIAVQQQKRRIQASSVGGQQKTATGTKRRWFNDVGQFGTLVAGAEIIGDRLVPVADR